MERHPLAAICLITLVAGWSWWLAGILRPGNPAAAGVAIIGVGWSIIVLLVFRLVHLLRWLR